MRSVYVDYLKISKVVVKCKHTHFTNVFAVFFSHKLITATVAKVNDYLSFHFNPNFGLRAFLFQNYTWDSKKKHVL